MKNAFRMSLCAAAIASATASVAQPAEPFGYGPVEIRDERTAQPSSPPPEPNDNFEGHSNNGFGAVRQGTSNWRVRGADARPASQNLSANHAIQVRRDPGTGHFIMPVLMNGVSIPVIIDTGASMTFLSPDAARLTGASGRTTHTRPMVGIGGAINLDMTRIDYFSVGGHEMGSFEAAISEKGLSYTLLGQSEIRKLGRIVIEGDVLTISPPTR